MNAKEYNDLCTEWHEGQTGQRLGQWLMNHKTDVVDSEIYYCKNKSEAATLFFNRYVVTSMNGPASYALKESFKLSSQSQSR